MDRRLIEPIGVITGSSARSALSSGYALPFQGAEAAFWLCRLIGAGPYRVVAAADIQASWRTLLHPVTQPPPDAGLPVRSLVMGILNATPDSFSDGGAYLDRAAAAAGGRSMIAAGADIIDLGGESTRPGARPTAPGDEQARILPILSALRGQGALISVDTRNASTMRAALDQGADLINDVSALSHDPDAARVLAAAECPVVLSHMRGTPSTMTGLARYDDVAAEVVRELAERIEHAVAAGIARKRIIVDPGIGFAKTEAQTLELLRRLPILANLGCRVLLGTSRKRFIGRITGIETPAARDPGSIASSLAGLVFPGCILRVHDVAGMIQALRVWQSVQG